MFWHFNQNNSGGIFDFDEFSGITVNVIIEADSFNQANSRAEEIGLYFNGCDTGVDCPCCGNRWYPAYDEGDIEPMYYGQSVKEAVITYNWVTKGKEICVHYLDGRKEWY